jgi:tetratricopeptide (TPR) repeat protein
MTRTQKHGRLEEIALPSLLMDLYRACFSGRLEVRRQRVTKSFLFDSGVPICAESNLASESLGVQLMDAGTISREDYSRVVDHVKKHECKEGTSLLSLELIDPRGLFLALKEQVRLRLIECFGWATGEFTIDPNVPPPANAQAFRSDIYSLLQAGVASHWSAERVLRDLEPNMARYVAPNARFNLVETNLESDDAVKALIGAIDGERVLWQALQAASTPKAMAAAWVMDAAGAVDYLAEPRVAAELDPVEVELVFGEQTETQPSEEATGAASTDAARTMLDPEAAAALREEIGKRFDRLDELGYYELLDVGTTAKLAEIKTSYLKTAKRYHPDALAKAGLEQEVRDRANKVFVVVGRAYSVLSDPKRRAEYDRARMDDEGPIDADRLATAESLYRKGEVLLRAGNFKGAIEFLAPAVELWPEETAYCSALGWALYKKMPSEPELARQHLELAIDLSSNDATAIYRLSVVLGSLGEKVAAAGLLERARRLDPEVG